MRNQIALLSILLLLSSTPFVQITPALGIDFRNTPNLQNPNTNLRGYLSGEAQSSNANPLIVQFLLAWENYSNLTTMLDKSIVVGLMTNQTQAIKTTVVSAGLDQGTMKSLVAKLDAAFDKENQASSYVLQAKPALVNNMLNATDNQLRSFINEVQALQGKKIPQQLAISLITSAQNLIQYSTLSGSSLAPLIPLTDLTLFNQLFVEIQTANQAVQVAVQNLVNAGFSVTVKFDSITLLLCGGTLVGCLLILAGATAIAQSLTLLTYNQMIAKGHPLTPTQTVQLGLANEAIFLAIAFGLFALGEVLAPLVATATGEAIGALPVGATTASVLARIYADHAIEAFVAVVLGQQVEQFLLGLIVGTLSPTPVLVRSFTITDTTFGRAVVNYFGRSTFFDNGRFWIFFWNGASVNFVTSPDGQSWSTPTLVSAASRIEDAPEWSIWFDGTYVHYAIACCSTSPFQGNDIFYRRGVPQADGTIAWSAPEQKLSLNAKYPMLTVDDQGFPWIIYQNVGASFRIDGVKSSTNDGTFAIQTGFPVVINPVCCGLGVSILSPMSGGKMLIESNAACCFGVPFQVQAWTGSSFLPVVSVGTTNGYAQGVSEGDRVHLVYLDGSNNIMDKVYSFASNSIVSSTLVVTGGSGIPVLSRDPGNGNIFVFYTTSNQLLFLKRDGSTGLWSTSPTSLVSEPSGFWTVGVTVSYEPYGGRFSLAYVRNTGAPQELMFFPFFG